jgi:hypothetical protein
VIGPKPTGVSHRLPHPGGATGGAVQGAGVLATPKINPREVATAHRAVMHRAAKASIGVLVGVHREPDHPPGVHALN